MSERAWIYSSDVQRAKQDGSAIVAIESAFVSHGLPWPENLETACELEAAVRQAGATPATIALLDGRIHIGLKRQQIEQLARGQEVAKASTRDLPWLVARRRTAGTTVAGTLMVANRARIDLVATGGIGGVHRGFETNWDVSADLTELARTPVALVCSGAKSILDLPRTLEWLETFGITVVGYRSNEFPGFLSTSSGLHVEARVESPAEAAAVIDAAKQMSMTSAIVFAVRPPAEVAIPRQELERITEQAIRDASSAQVQGSRLTPYLLERVRELAGDRALLANRALLVRNAELAGQIAAKLVGHRHFGA